jgi:hypothetical protein
VVVRADVRASAADGALLVHFVAGGCVAPPFGVGSATFGATYKPVRPKSPGDIAWLTSFVVFDAELTTFTETWPVQTRPTKISGQHHVAH